MAAKKKKKTGMLVGLVLLILLCGVYILLRMSNAETDDEAQETEEETITAVEIDTEMITSFSVISATDGELLSFVKEEELWYYEGDKDFPVEQSAVESKLSYLSSLSANRELQDIGDEELQEYGFENPGNIITIHQENGTETVLYIGIQNAGTYDYYTYVNEPDKIYMVGSATPAAFSFDLYDVVDAEDFPEIDAGTMYHYLVEQGRESIEAAKVNNDSSYHWYLSKNGEGRTEADDTALNELFTSLSELSYDACVDYGAQELSEFGLDDPSAVITAGYTVTYEEQVEEEESETSGEAVGESAASDEAGNEAETEDAEVKTIEVEETVVLLIGDRFEIESGNEEEEPTAYYYIQEQGASQVHRIKADNLEPILEMAVEEYYDSYLSLINIDDVEKLLITYDGEEHELRRETVTEIETDDDGEETEKETKYFYVNGAEVESTPFTTLYTAVIGIKAESFEEGADMNGDPEVTIEFRLKDGTTTVIEYIPYDSSFYAADTDRGLAYINKLDIASLVGSLKNLLAEVE